MLPPCGLLAGPDADPPTMQHRPVVHGRNNVTTATAVIIIWATPAPLAVTGATIQPEVNIIFPVGLMSGYLEPIWANLSDLIAATFFLNLLRVRYYTSHPSPPPY